MVCLSGACFLEGAIVWGAFLWGRFLEGALVWGVFLRRCVFVGCVFLKNKYGLMSANEGPTKLSVRN